VRVDEPIGDVDLERIHNLLADVVEGRTLAALRDLFARRLEGERVQLDELRHKAFDLGQRAVETVGRQEVVIEGGSRLMDLPAYADAERLRKLVHALEDRESLVDLLDRTISAGTVSVYIGQESGELGQADLSLVAAPYGGGEEGAGTIGVIGPTRMDYARVMPLVGATAEAISAIIRKPRS
jgi:heat-inducible transcriptional repressor